MLIFIILYLFCVFVALGLGVLAGWSDFKGMTIPNALVAIILAAFAIAFSAAHFSGADIFDSLKSHLISGGMVFIVTFAMFLMKWVGGGDSKLATVFGFWVGLKGIAAFLFYMMAAGGLLGVVAIWIMKKKPCKDPAEGSWIARLQSGDNVVPYGIPIALGAFAGFIDADLLDIETLTQFLM